MLIIVYVRVQAGKFILGLMDTVVLWITNRGLRLSLDCFELGKEVSLSMIYLYVEGRVKRQKTRNRSDGTT